MSLHRCAAADSPITAALQLHFLVLLENIKQLFAIIEITGASLSPGGQRCNKFCKLRHNNQRNSYISSCAEQLLTHSTPHVPAVHDMLTAVVCGAAAAAVARHTTALAAERLHTLFQIQTAAAAIANRLRHPPLRRICCCCCCCKLYSTQPLRVAWVSIPHHAAATVCCSSAAAAAIKPPDAGFDIRLLLLLLS
jgi:hypothetical protein